MSNVSTALVSPKKSAEAKCSLEVAEFLQKYVFFVPKEGKLKSIPSTDLTRTGDNSSELVLYTIQATNCTGVTLLLEAWDKAVPFVSKFFR